VDARWATAGLAVAALALQGCMGPGLCVHGVNWPFKIGMDPQAREVSLAPVPTTIDELLAVPHVERPADGRRIAPVELTTYALRDVQLRSFQRAPDGDVHMVLADEHGHTLIVEATPPFCTDAGSPWRAQIAAVRAVVDAEIPYAIMGVHRRVVSLAGVGYIDSLHGQMGVAPNGIELHPIMAICFGQGCALPDPRGTDAARAAVTRALDDLHDAAARADEARYFAHFADDAVFLGTDATERWDLPAFRAFAHPHFAAGKAWSFHAVRRAVTFSADGRLAWFDEDLATEKLGPARGSGVLALRDGAWKIEQYNLASTIPNERFAAVRALLDAPPPSPAAPSDEAYRAAYGRSVAAAARGDLEGAQRELEVLVTSAEVSETNRFWLHNELTWIRWAEGDLLGALAEADAQAFTGAATASLRLHAEWDRAYILRELVDHAVARDRTRTLAAADAAKSIYDADAAAQGDHQGTAVLAAFFAVRAGDAKTAVASASKVDADEDDDLQDLYVLALAFDLGRDRARAEQLRAKIRAGHEYLMKPLIVRQMATDVTRRPSR
jgi:hypothetical protein